MQKSILTDEKDWLELRDKVITATEGASILGLNKWQSAMQMWRNKTESTFTGNAYTRIGQLLEPVVVEVVNEITGHEFELYEHAYKGKVFFHDTEIGIGATPDAVEKDTVLLECKTTKPFNYLKYRGIPPEQYIMQLQIQMYCTGINTGYLAIMSTDLTQHTEELDWPIAIYKVDKCEALIEMYLRELDRFWKCVRGNTAYRVNSKSKIKARLLSKMCYREYRYE